MTGLVDLDFTDLYVRLDDISPSRYAPAQRKQGITPGNLRVPEEYDEEIRSIRSALMRQERDDFSLDISGMRLRGSRCVVFLDQTWVALRRLPLDPPNLEDLGMPDGIIEEFRSWGLRSGLIVIGGPTGAGKTTTAVALLTDYLRRLGKVGFTIEDPVEYFLQGEYGKDGFCYQVEVHNDHEWAERVKTALRWRPRYILVGEVRTAQAAKGLLRAATTGHLVICTIHGGSIEETLSAILQTVSSELGDTANSLLADGLCAVIHQNMVKGRPKVRLLTADVSPADPVRSAIRDGKLQTLGTQIEAQAARRNVNSQNDSGQTDVRPPPRPQVLKPADTKLATRPGDAPTKMQVPAKPAPEPKKKISLW